MNLYFLNGFGETYNLSEKFLYRVSAYTRRVNTIDRYGKSGGVVAGDEQVGVRNIDLKYNILATDDTTYLAELNGLIGFMTPDDGPFYLVDSDNSRRTLIRYTNGDDAPVDGAVLRVGPANLLALAMLDSHWEDLNANYVYSDSAGMASGDTLVVPNDGTVDCYPVIRVASLIDNPDFTLTNNTLGISTRIGSNAFVPGTTIILDSVEGTMLLDNGTNLVDVSPSLFDGTGFIRLAAGNNTLEYYSLYGSVEVEIEYRRRWPF